MLSFFRNKRFKVILALALVVVIFFTGCTSTTQSTGQSTETLPTIENQGTIDKSYDVIVVGTDPEGIAAAISASRNGLKTLLLSKDQTLGGLYTLGALNFIDVPETPSGSVLVKGIYEEFFNKVGGSGFDLAKAATTFQKMIAAEKNITLRMENTFQEPIMNGNTIIGVRMQENGQTVDYYAPYVIDATQDGDVAAASGAPFTFAGEDIGEKDRAMGVTLVFRLSGVNWAQVVRHLGFQRTIGELFHKSTSMGFSGNTAWGYTEEGYGYQPKDTAMRLRGFNIAKQENGDVLINALIVFDVNVLDETSKQQGIERAKKELEYIVPYLQENCKGFKKAKLVGTAEQLYVRESRHIDCEYNLTVDDELEHNDQSDRLVVTSYPIDVQPTKTQTWGTVVGYPDQYAIGYKSLVPKNIDGLLVVGRAAGYTSLAAGSARIVPTGMACGQAAGVAVKVAKDLNAKPRDLVNNEDAVAKMQTLLKNQGANVNFKKIKVDIMDNWAYEGIKVFRSMGVLDGGYDNDYGLEGKVSQNMYQNMVNNAIKKAGFSLKDKIIVNENPPTRQIIGTMARACIEIEGKEKLDNDNQAYLKALEERKIMDKTLLSYFEDMEQTPDADAVVMLTARFYSYLTTLLDAKRYKAIDVIDLEQTTEKSSQEK